jgi:hypothetical protein
MCIFMMMRLCAQFPTDSNNHMNETVWSFSEAGAVFNPNDILDPTNPFSTLLILNDVEYNYLYVQA